MKHILIVDDEAALLRAARRTLQSFGYRATIANSAEEALAAFAADPPDLVLTDHSMPGMTGLSLAAALKGIRPELPVVIFTGAPNAAELEGAVRNGLVAAIVTKPWSSAELADLLAGLLSPG